MSARPWRRRALFGALAVTVALALASAMAERAADAPVPAVPARPPAPSANRAPATSTSVARVELERLQRQDATPDARARSTSQVFGAMGWDPPPPAPPKVEVKPAPPPPPTAPPMPFSFLGRYEEGGVRTFMLVRGDRIYTVVEGEVIDNTYRVERLAAGQLELTYLPLSIKQTLSVGDT